MNIFVPFSARKETFGDNSEVNDFGAFRAREHQVLTVYNVF
jgi:hypothetical protein